jgi:hypothetical protein
MKLQLKRTTSIWVGVNQTLNQISYKNMIDSFGEVTIKTLELENEKK